MDRLSIGVLGGTQPDLLRILLLKSDDDGLLARPLPLWPDAVPIRRPKMLPYEAFIETALSRLHNLNMATNESDELRPWLVPFSGAARDHLDTFRHAVRDSESLMLSFIGKLSVSP